jgi:hypothetical protein
MCPIKVFRASFLLLMVLTVFTIFVCADTIVLRSGSSYNGQLGGGPITFADAQGVNTSFPRTTFNPWFSVRAT